MLEDTRNEWEIRMQEIEDEQESFWNSLSKEDQLKAFCAVVRRIHEGDVELNGSYRYVLYDVFEFGPESYVRAQYAGYLDIHNLIYYGLESRKSPDEVLQQQLQSGQAVSPAGTV